MAKCPNCREEMPLLSKVCPACGYTEESAGTGATPAEFVHKMEGILLDVKNLPSPTFMRSMGQLAFIMLPILAVYMLAVAIISEAGLFWILFGVFLIMAIVAIVRKARGKTGNDKTDREFKALKNEMEYNKRTAMHSYGKSAEVAKVMTEINNEIDRVERSRKAASGRNIAVWIVILIVVFAAAGLGVFKMDRSLNPTSGDTVQTAIRINGVAVDGLQKAVDMVKGMSANDSGVEQARVDLTTAMLQAGEAAKAEEFFLGSVMGQMKDYDCAELIVKHYVDAGQKEAAQTFAAKCTSMRYASDKGKLEKLIN